MDLNSEIYKFARGLYRRWRISLRPETDYIYIIYISLLFVNTFIDFLINVTYLVCVHHFIGRGDLAVFA